MDRYLKQRAAWHHTLRYTAGVWQPDRRLLRPAAGLFDLRDTGLHQPGGSMT